MTEKEIRNKIKELQDLLPPKRAPKAVVGVRITKEGVETLTPRKAAMAAAKAEAQRTGRVVTVTVSSKVH